MESYYKQLLEIYKNKPHKEYEDEAKKLKEEYTKVRDFGFQYTHFIPYPSYQDQNFNKIIYKKEEFHRNKSHWEDGKDYDNIVQDKCTGEFRSTPNQKFLKNFMSPVTPYKSLLVFHHVGTGKCMAKNTPILMYDGSIKMIQDVKVGDKLMGDDSTPRNVLSLATGQDEMYDIIPDKGDKYTVNKEHILVLKSTENIVEIEVKNYIKLPEHLQKELKGFRTGVEFPYKEISIDPYTLGLWLIDGADRYNLINNNSIPHLYKCNNRDIRLKLLAGILDAKNVIKSDTLIQDVLYLARSLGFAAYHENNKINITGKEIQQIPTRLKQNNNNNDENALITNITVKHIGKGDYYGFTLDGNNRYLIGDFTVTHNTCTAINIAEQYYDTFEKRVLVILSENIENNFKKQIFDINKTTQCTGTKYQDMVADKHILTKSNLEDKVKAIIKQRYQFMGYKKLANIINNLKTKIQEQVMAPKDPAKLPEIILRRETLFKEAVRERFSNRLIIVDEAHNLRLSSEKGNKEISTAFKELLVIAENVKLVMMTATPMYNIADEIVWMMNLLLINNRADTITRAQIFDKESNLTEAGKEVLRNVSRGYVSYMRGENPFSFPIRLWPSINNRTDPNILTKYPKKDIYGETILEKTKVKFLEIITSKMDDDHYKVYKSFKKKIKPITDIIEDIEEEIENNDVQNTMQVSNVTYPIDLDKLATESRKTYGSVGFQNCFDIITKMKVFRVKYKKHIKEEYGEFLSYDSLPKHAPKFKTIIDYIKNAQGIVFIYSRYYWAGLYPLACALEHAGMTHFSSDKKDRHIIDDIKINDQFNGTKPKYIILSTNEDLSPNNNLEIELAKSKDNIDGSMIKVIIVSKIGTEGIDFKRIREVHIVEPWYNLNRAEQIIGRAVRTCSHIDLPKEQRNVTIYFHANICPDPNEESVDLRTYRICENKQKKIIEVENILKQSAIDCNLNKDILMFLPKRLDVKFDIKTAQGKIIKNYEMGDKDFSFVCGFKKCEESTDSKGRFICLPELPETNKLDNTTFDVDFISDDVSLMTKYIANLYINDIKPRTYSMILDDLKKNYKLIEEDIVSFALEEMIEQKHIFKVKKGSGYLIYKSDKYIFQYENILDIRMAIEDRFDLETRGKRLEIDVKKIMKKMKIEKTSTEEKEVEKAALTDIDALFESYYKKFVLFILDVETKNDELSSVKAYIKQFTKRKDYQKIIYEYIQDQEPTETDTEIGKLAIERIKEKLDNYHDTLSLAVIDRLKINDLFEIKRKYKDLYKIMQESDMVIDDFIVNPIDKKLYKLKNDKIVECTHTERILVQDKYFKTTKIQDKPTANLYNIWQKNELVFKIREKKSVIGAVCGTSSNKDYLVKKIEELYGVKKLKFSYTKQWLCFIIEVLSRKEGKFERALYIK